MYIRRCGFACLLQCLDVHALLKNVMLDQPDIAAVEDNS